MDYQTVASQVLSHLGGSSNVVKGMTCLTRLRITVADIDRVKFDDLRSQTGVLGVVKRNQNELEVVFGPATIEGVAAEFSKLTNIDLSSPNTCASASLSPLEAMGASKDNSPETNLSEPAFDEPSSTAPAQITKPAGYSISAGKRQSYAAQQQAAISAGRLAAEDIDSLQAFLASNGDKPQQGVHIKNGKAVLVINGPNINMLGIREPALYGREDYNALVRTCKAAAQEAGFADIRCYQSNHEGALVDEIQNALGVYDGIVINPGAYTHTSVAILDAVKAVNLPCVEVHISKVEEREDFRQISYIRAACFETITGLGIEGYRKAILDLAKHLEISA